MRVGIIALSHESNTFISKLTTFDQFEQNTLIVGQVIRTQLADAHHEIGGFFEGLECESIETVPIFVARTMPYGTVTADAYARLLEIMFDALGRAGRLDGILVAPHGAIVSESVRDGDGHWLAELRKRVGPVMPLIGAMDPHANLSSQMIDSTDALIAYRSNPHLDQRARGIEAATLMARTLRGEIRPTQAGGFPPIAINIERQLTSAPQCVPLYQLADEILARPRVISNSILLGFPYADVEEMGSSVLVVTDDDVPLAGELATEMADYLWSHRQDFVGQMIGVEEALDRTEKLDGPICLLDMGDNVGGGSPGDSTHLAHPIHKRRLPDSLICLYDPESVEAAVAAGPGHRLRMRVGGKIDDLHGEPLDDEFTVIGLHDGKFDEPEARHGGHSQFDQGASAVVRNDGLTVLLNSRRVPPMSLRQLTSCGLDPTQFHIIVAKGVNAPVAAYRAVCQHMIRVNTPGCTAADMTLFHFEHRRRPMIPFEMDTSWQPCAARSR